MLSTAAKQTVKAGTRGFRSTATAEARKYFVGGNWKCNGSLALTNELVGMLNGASLNTSAEVVIAPSAIHLGTAKAGLRDDVGIASQDVWTNGGGAFTGETSAEMLTDLGVGYAVVGHSERRGKGESNEACAEKAAYALSKGLKVR